MNLYQLRDMIENSSAAEWVKVEPAGPTYRYRFEVSTDRDGGEQVSVDTHRAVAVYTADVNLTMAYGMPEVKGTRWRNEDLSFEWATFPDKRFTVENADIFWAGALIHRVNYLGADGGRTYLPLGGGNDGLDVTRLDVAVAGIIDDLEGGSRFRPYVDRVPYRIQD